jgi:hypothetical protein
MPVLVTIGAVAVIATLMVIGIRHRWDPAPGPLPPSSMSVPAPAPEPIPRWFWVLFVAGFGAPIVLVAISVATERPWIAVAGYLVFGLGWVARQVLGPWMSGETKWRRIVAVLRPVAFVSGFLATAATDSAWWVLGGLIVYLAILPLADAVAWWRGRQSTPQGADAGAPREG